MKQKLKQEEADMLDEYGVMLFDKSEFNENEEILDRLNRRYNSIQREYKDKQLEK